MTELTPPLASARLEAKIVEVSTQSRLDLPRPLVFTNGVFDILHRGHVTYLAAARALGAGLFVGVNADTSVRLLGKGPQRPINDERDRAIVLAALESVDRVAIFEERTPEALLTLIKPDIYVKGGDYTLDTLPEAKQVARWGGKTVIIPFVDGYSTTSTVRRLAAQ